MAERIGTTNVCAMMKRIAANGAEKLVTQQVVLRQEQLQAWHQP